MLAAVLLLHKIFVILCYCNLYLIFCWNGAADDYDDSDDGNNDDYDDGEADNDDYDDVDDSNNNDDDDIYQALLRSQLIYALKTLVPHTPKKFTSKEGQTKEISQNA